jgi:hypothetical protein
MTPGFSFSHTWLTVTLCTQNLPGSCFLAFCSFFQCLSTHRLHNKGTMSLCNGGRQQIGGQSVVGMDSLDACWIQASVGVHPFSWVGVVPNFPPRDDQHGSHHAWSMGNICPQGGLGFASGDTNPGNPKLRWILFSTGSSMPSLPPCDGDATKQGADINAQGATITAIGLPHDAVGKGKIVIFLNNNIDNIVVTLLLPSTTYGGEHNTFGRP